MQSGGYTFVIFDHSNSSCLSVRLSVCLSVRHTFLVTSTPLSVFIFVHFIFLYSIVT